MKLLLTTILILSALLAFPQKDTIRHSPNFLDGTDTLYIYDMYDTVPVWIQCQDTLIHYDVYDLWQPDSIQKHADDTGYSAFIWNGHTIHDTTGHWTNNTVYGIRGYNVRKNSPSFDNWDCGLNSCLGWRDHFEHIMFLDEKKKPLQYFVWSYK